MTMTHPGMPFFWVLTVWIAMLGLGFWALLVPRPGKMGAHSLNLADLPLIGSGIRRFNTNPWPLLALKILTVALFLLVITAGLFGTPIAERNIATLLTWNIWWTGVIVSIFFLGSAWCAVCPWDALAGWLTRRRLYQRADTGLNLRFPKKLRNLWPALLLLIGLTWLELGVGVTTSPYATALLALLMVVLATVSLALFERKAFCHYLCPVGRTVGFYAQLALVELRPYDPDVCLRCTTLDCYHGNQTIEPCPTHLVMGRLTQNTYCTSCSHCIQSCPHQNVSWRLRPPSVEAMQNARPHWDEAWFMLGLLALTGFHGITMLPFWEHWLSTLAQQIGDSGQLLASFSIGLLACLTIPILLYTGLAGLTYRLSRTQQSFRRVFSGLAFVALPLAFAYHLAHNLNHLIRENDGLGAVLANPLGIDTQPLSTMERHTRHLNMAISQDTLFALQAGLILFGFWIALQVLRHRTHRLFETDLTQSTGYLLPMLVFAIGISSFHLWLLMQPMIMRM